MINWFHGLILRRIKIINAGNSKQHKDGIKSPVFPFALLTVTVNHWYMEYKSLSLTREQIFFFQLHALTINLGIVFKFDRLLLIVTYFCISCGGVVIKRQCWKLMRACFKSPFHAGNWKWISPVIQHQHKRIVSEIIS